MWEKSMKCPYIEESLLPTPFEKYETENRMSPYVINMQNKMVPFTVNGPKFKSAAGRNSSGFEELLLNEMWILIVL